MIDARLYLLQRISALVMVPLVMVHIVVMIVAVRGGLTAAEILGRTQGSVFWFAFYGLFVLAVSVHGAIGLRMIVCEWGRVRGDALAAIGWIVFALLFFMGARAVWAVTFA